MPEKETYLGDGAYAQWHGYGFSVYASNGIERTNEVYLDLRAIDRLVEFAVSHGYQLNKRDAARGD